MSQSKTHSGTYWYGKDVDKFASDIKAIIEKNDEYLVATNIPCGSWHAANKKKRALRVSMAFSVDILKNPYALPNDARFICLMILGKDEAVPPQLESITLLKREIPPTCSDCKHPLDDHTPNGACVACLLQAEAQKAYLSVCLPVVQVEKAA